MGFSLAWYGEIFSRSRLAQRAREQPRSIARQLRRPGGRDRLAARLVPVAATRALGADLFSARLAPFILPPVITALGFLHLLGDGRLLRRSMAATISHAIFFVTLPLVTLSLGFASIDRPAGRGGVDHGRRRPQTVFRTIVLPLVRPYLVSGYAFAFVLSLNEYIVAYMVVGFTMETLPIKIFNALRYGYTPTMAAVAVVFVLVAAWSSA